MKNYAKKKEKIKDVPSTAFLRGKRAGKRKDKLINFNECPYEKGSDIKDWVRGVLEGSACRKT